MNWMCLQQILWSNNIPAWAGKSINFIEDFSITESGEFACLFLSDTASNFDIKDKGVGTGEFKSSSIVTLNVLVTDGFIGKVENTISFLTLGVSVWGWLLNKFSGPAVYIMRKRNTWDGVKCQVMCWFELRCHYVSTRKLAVSVPLAPTPCAL